MGTSKALRIGGRSSSNWTSTIAPMTWVILPFPTGAASVERARATVWVRLELVLYHEKYLKNPINFFNLREIENFNDLLNIDGIGDTQIKSIEKFFQNKKNLIVLEELRKCLIISSEKESLKNGILKNKTFLFTGKLQGISRAEAKSLVEKNSGKIVSNVSQKLNFLIIGDKPTKRKVSEAKSLNIKIISQLEFLKMLNIKDS